MGHAPWLADAARRWGLTVVEIDGWQTRGSSSFSPGGTVAHHTAGPEGGGDIPSLNTLIHGRPDLDGPLCNYGLGRSGTVYVIAAGRANHAGGGGWNGLSGNSSVVGIEAENNGYQPWPAEQLEAYGRLGAAICEALGVNAAMTCRHHEWRSEKPDPHDLDGDTGRAQVAELLERGPGPDRPDPQEDIMKATYTMVRGHPEVWLAGLGIDARPVELFGDVEYLAGREGLILLEPPADGREQVADGSGTVRWVMTTDAKGARLLGIPGP